MIEPYVSVRTLVCLRFKVAVAAAAIVVQTQLQKRDLFILPGLVSCSTLEIQPIRSRGFTTLLKRKLRNLLLPFAFTKGYASRVSLPSLFSFTPTFYLTSAPCFCVQKNTLKVWQRGTSSLKMKPDFAKTIDIGWNLQKNFLQLEKQMKDFFSLPFQFGMTMCNMQMRFF